MLRMDHRSTVLYCVIWGGQGFGNGYEGGEEVKANEDRDITLNPYIIQ